MRLRPTLASLTLVALGACAAPPDAAADIVDPWTTTLARLARDADAVVLARVAAGEGRGGRSLAVEGVLRLAEGLPAPVSAALPACVAASPEALAIAFLDRDPSGRYVLLGSERGFLAGDDEAASYVRTLLAARAASGEAPPVSLHVDALASASARVRDDALREVARALASKAAIAAASRDAVLRAARAALLAPGTGDPEPALLALSRLSGGAGEPALLDAARRGVAAKLTGAALRGHASAIASLIADLGRADLDAPTASSILRTLGNTADRRATPALVAALARRETRRAAFEGLTALADPSAVPALTPFLGDGAPAEDLPRAAVALAYSGGDEALGALEFARWNHEDPAARRLVEALLARPAETRAAVEEGGR